MIVYYYPAQENKAGCKAAAKKYWFQEAALKAEELCGGQIIGCAVPPFYYRHKSWRPEVLSEAMDGVLCRVEGMADTYVHPQVGAMLTEAYIGRWLPRRSTMEMLTARIIEEYAGNTVRQCGEATVLLGAPADTDWQMEMTRGLLLPYLSRINKLVIYYEEIAETDIWMELGNHLDEYYYEYGLVPQLEPYTVNYAGIMSESEAGKGEAQMPQAGAEQSLRCGRTKCAGMILDYCAQFRYPRIAPGSKVIYIDAVSVAGKENALRRKTPQASYVSPLKYLDTVVKTSYDG